MMYLQRDDRYDSFCKSTLNGSESKVLVDMKLYVGYKLTIAWQKMFTFV